MAKVAGRVESVFMDKAGTVVNAPANVGDTVVSADFPVDFDENGGNLTRETADPANPDSTVYVYSTVDTDAETITLAAPLTAAWSVGDMLYLDPPAVEARALVRLSDSEDEPAVECRVDHALRPLIPEGARDPGMGESVLVEPTGDEWVITDVVGQVPVLDGSVIDPATLPASGSSVYVQDTDPAVTVTPADGAVWFDTANHAIKSYSAALPGWVNQAFDANNIIEAATILGTRLANQSVGSAQLASNAVGSGNIAAGAVGNTQLAGNAVNASKIAAGAVGTSQIAGNAVGSGQLANGAVGTPQLGSSAVQSGNIASGAVGSAQLGSAAVQSGNIAAGAVSTASLANNAVTSAKVANGTLTAAQLAAAAGILGTQLANATITSGNIAANTIVASNIAADTITGNEIAANAVTAGNIVAGAIDAEKLSVDALDGRVINAPVINGGNISGADFIISPGTNTGVFGYNTPPPTTYYVSATGAGSWTCPPGVTSVKVEAIGAGGGGAGGTVTNANPDYVGGGGGGGGEYASATVAVTPGKTYSYSVGVHGNSGAGENPPSAGANATAGGDTVFTGDTVTVTAHGGKGATYGTNQANPSLGGAGGSGSTNTVHFPGGNGGNGVRGFGAGGGASASAKGAGGNGSNSAVGSPGSGGIPLSGGGAGGNGDNATDPSLANAGAGVAPGGGGGGGRGTGYTNPMVSAGGNIGGDGRLSITYSVSGTPQLLVSAASVSGTDPYGSPVQDGFTAYDGPAYIQVHTNQANGCPAIEMYSGLASESLHPSIYTLPFNKGATNERESLYIAGPSSKKDNTPPAIRLESNANDGSYGNYIVFQVGSTNQAYVEPAGFHFPKLVFGSNGVIPTPDALTAIQPGTPDTTETWHFFTPPAPSSGSFTYGTGQVGRYKKMPFNALWVCFECNCTGLPASPTIVTLPTGYIPKYQCAFPVRFFLASSPAVFEVGGVCDTSGNIQVRNVPSGTAYLAINALIPLD